MGFGLGSFRQDYGNRFRDWSNKFKIRILLLDPSFPSSNLSFVQQRDAEEHNPEGHTAQDVEEFIRFAKSLGLNKSNFQIRLMRVLPSINIFRVDDEIFWGPYLIDQQSRNTITLVMKKGGFSYSQLKTHFDAIWSDDAYSVKVDL
jgi:hypothetical protein